MFKPLGVYVVVKTSCDYEGTYYEGIEGAYFTKEDAMASIREKEKSSHKVTDISYRIEFAPFTVVVEEEEGEEE